MTTHSEEVDNDQIRIIDYFRVVFKYRFIIILVVLASISCSYFVVQSKPDIYEATASFFPINFRNPVVSEFEPRQKGTEISNVNLIMALLKSRKMANRIVNQQNLQSLWADDLKSRVRETLQNMTSVQLEKLGFIRLTVKSTSPQLAANIANAYVDNLSYFNETLSLGSKKKIVQLIDLADIPDSPTPKKLKKVLMRTAFLSFFFTVFGCFVIEYLRSLRQSA